MRFFVAFAIALLGLFFIAAGVNHFANAPAYVRIVPPWLPAPEALVVASGVCEVLGGLGVLFPATRRIAGFGLIGLLIAVFPANLQMAMHPDQFRDLGTPTAFLIRLPLQAVLIAWVWWASRRR